MSEDIDVKRTVFKYKEVVDENGKTKIIPIYLKETPKEDIDRMNIIFDEHKRTKQVKYDKEGMRL